MRVKMQLGFCLENKNKQNCWIMHEVRWIAHYLKVNPYIIWFIFAMHIMVHMVRSLQLHGESYRKIYKAVGNKNRAILYYWILSRKIRKLRRHFMSRMNAPNYRLFVIRNCFSAVMWNHLVHFQHIRLKLNSQCLPRGEYWLYPHLSFKWHDEQKNCAANGLQSFHGSIGRFQLVKWLEMHIAKPTFFSSGAWKWLIAA